MFKIAAALDELDETLSNDDALYDDDVISNPVVAPNNESTDNTFV
jgi:hypothetical protein